MGRGLFDRRPPGRRREDSLSGGVEVSGEVLEIADGERIAFTYGYDSGQPIPPGTSRVTITCGP